MIKCYAADLQQHDTSRAPDELYFARSPSTVGAFRVGAAASKLAAAGTPASGGNTVTRARSLRAWLCTPSLAPSAAGSPCVPSGSSTTLVRENTGRRRGWEEMRAEGLHTHGLLQNATTCIFPCILRLCTRTCVLCTPVAPPAPRACTFATRHPVGHEPSFASLWRRRLRGPARGPAFAQARVVFCAMASLSPPYRGAAKCGVSQARVVFYKFRWLVPSTQRSTAELLNARLHGVSR